MAPTDGGAMHTLQSHIEDMRSSTNCKICLKPFYEPYILACGHTYCYTCLRSWFIGRSPDGPRNNKNCPDCRAPVNIQPAPNYAIRDITHMFIQRVELIAEDETVEGHAKDMKVEAEILNKDRNGPGLFCGIFSAQPRGHLAALLGRRAINDYEDNVSRCPICAWEIEDGLCAGCGFDIDSNDLDMSDFYDTEDDGDSDEGSLAALASGSSPVRTFNLPQLDSDEDNSDVDHSGIDQYDEHDDFIDNENEDDADDIDNTSEIHALYGDNLSQSSHGSTIQDDLLSLRPSRRSRPSIAMHFSSDRESSSDVPTNYDESGDEDDNDNEGFRPVPESPRMTRSLRRRPIVISDDEEEQETYHNANETATTSEDESASSEDSSDTSSNASKEDDDEDGNEIENEEESDDTVIPPQSGRSRHERLVNHRARRPDKNTSRAVRSSTNTASRPQTSRTSLASSRVNMRINGRTGPAARPAYVY